CHSAPTRASAIQWVKRLPRSRAAAGSMTRRRSLKRPSKTGNDQVLWPGRIRQLVRQTSEGTRCPPPSNGERPMNATRARPLRNVLLAALVVLTNGSLVVPARAAAAALAGTTWQLVRFQDSNGQVLTADDRSSYTVEFRTDDTVAVRVDCHRGRGTWVSRSASQLELGPVVLTRAACPQTPLHAQIAKQWTSIRSYELRDAHLFLSLGPNGGAFEFEPAAAAATAPTSTASTAAVPAAAVPAAATAPVATTPAPTAPTAVAPAPASKAPLSWLDDPKPVSWTTAGAAIPRAPHPTGT